MCGTRTGVAELIVFIHMYVVLCDGQHVIQITKRVKAPFFLVSWTPFSVELASKVSAQSWQAINVYNVAFMGARRNQSVWAERETAFNEMNAAVMAISAKAEAK